VSGLFQDLRLAFRRLVRSPGTTLVVLITLALGIGASTTVFAVFNVLVLGPLPFGEPESLIRLRETHATPGQPDRATSVAGYNYHAWRERSTLFSDMAAARFRTLTLAGDGEPERVVGIGATWNKLPLLGAEPVLGRTFRPDEDRPGNPAPVAVISHSLWSRRFGRDPRAVGGEIVINGRPHTIVGVMPLGFRYPYSAEVWVPLGLGPESDEWTRGNLNISARLASGATFEAAREEMEAIATGLRDERPTLNAGTGVRLIHIRDEVLEGVDAKVRALLLAAIFVLLIASANVASMVLARMQHREREVAVQIALGASRSDIARPILVESLLLAASGGALGLLLAGWVGPPLAAMSPVDDLGPFFQDIGVDLRVVAFALAASLLVTLLFSLPAILRAGRAGADAVLRGTRGTAGGRSESRILDGLVVTEVAIALVLLTGAGLMVKSIRNLQTRDVGIETENLLTFGIAPSISGYQNAQERLAFLDQLLERLRGMPGVEAAAFTNFNPLRDHGWGARIWPEDRPVTSENDQITVNHRAVSAGYFETAGTDFLSGRGFTRADGPNAPGVVVVSASLAERLWPGDEAEGRSIRVGRGTDTGPLLTVVGVVEDVADFGVLQDTWYRPYSQDPSEFTTRILEVFVRTSGRHDGVIDGVRISIQELDPGLPVFNIQPVAEIVRFERRVEAFTTLLLSLFAGVGLLLASVGIYGVLSYAVGRRTRELGVRIAMGARPSEILLHVLRGALLVSGVGLVLGLIAAGVLTRFLGSFLVEVSPLDVEVFVAMTVGALMVTGLAAYLPAWRAMRVDPWEALREE
jgi:putative ABC transport system permease protein